MNLVNAGTSVARNRQYREWVKSLKAKIRRAQAKAAVRVNVELLRLYWGMEWDVILPKSAWRRNTEADFSTI